MAKLSQADLMSQFKEMSLVELSEFVKAFEEEFDVDEVDDLGVVRREVLFPCLAS